METTHPNRKIDEMASKIPPKSVYRIPLPDLSDRQERKGDLPPPFFLGAAACHGGVGGPIGPIASKEGRFYNRPGVVTQKSLDRSLHSTMKLFRELEERLE